MNRTRIGIVSTIVIVIEAVLIGALTMIRTKYILEGYGTNINGVIQLANQLTAYMLLFESGMTAAYQYNLYTPLIENDNNKISGLYKGMIYDFRIIAIKMLICVLGVSFIYSLVLQNRGVTYAEAVALLSVMGIRLVSPYLFTVPLRTMIIVKERKYITDMVETIKNVTALILEIILIKNTSIPLFWILMIQVVLCYCTRHIYRWLLFRYYGDQINEGSEMDRSPKKMTSDILVHRVSGLINSNTDSVLLSMFKDLGLSSVTIYTTFSTIITYPISLVTRIVDSMRATLALKINSNGKESYSYYREMLAFSKICVLIIIPVYISQVNDFVSLWIGKEYTVNSINTILFGLTAMHQILIPTIYATRDAFGLYKESKKYSLAQAIVNMSVSLILIKWLGITGVLIGTVVSDWLVIEPLNIRLIFKKVFSKKFDMLFDYIMLFVMIFLTGSICGWLNRTINYNHQGWSTFIIKTIVVTIASTCISGVFLYLTDYGFRKLLGRFIHRI